MTKEYFFVFLLGYYGAIVRALTHNHMIVGSSPYSSPFSWILQEDSLPTFFLPSEK